MFEDYLSWQIQQTALGFVITASQSQNGKPSAWTARTIEAATASILNDFYIPKPTNQTKGN